MKKLLSLILALLLMFSVTLGMAEVSFNGVEFLSYDDVVVNTLIEKGIVSGEASLTNDKSIYLAMNELLGYQPTYVQNYQDVCFSQILPGRGKIAGAPLKDLILTYAYDGSYKLISIKVELIGTDYETLLAKLTRVYGEANVETVEEEGITSNIWQDGETAIVLYTESEGLDYTLMYGRTDAEEILASCLVPADPDDVSGL